MAWLKAISFGGMFHFSLDKLQLSGFFKKYFDNRNAALLCILFAILNKSLIAWIYTDLEADKSLYMLFAKIMMEGHHPLEPLGLVDGRQNYIFNGAITSPLYSVLAIPFLWLTQSYTATSVILDVLSWSVFFTGLYRFSLLLLESRWIPCVLVLCTGFFIYPYQLQSGPKDTLSIGLMLWICTYLVHFYSTAQTIKKSLLLAVLLVALGLIKLLYAPLVLVFIALTWFITFQANKKGLVKHSLLITVLCFAAAILFYQYLNYLKQLASTGIIEAPSFSSEFQEGFYPENIKLYYPFISSSLINLDFWCLQLSDIFNVSYERIGCIFQWLDLLLVVPTVIVLFRIVKHSSRLKWLPAVTVAGTILFMVFFMTFSYKSFPRLTGSWTYISETRFYLFIIILLQIVLFYVIFRSPVSATLKNFLLLLFLIECVHGLYFNIKQVINKEAVQHKIASGPIKKVTRFLQTTNKLTDQPLALSTPEMHLRYYVQMHSLPVIYYRSNSCNTVNDRHEHPLLIVNFPKDSLPFKQCITDRMLITTDTISPYILRLYSK